SAGDTQRVAGPDRQHAGSREADVARERGRAAGAALRGALGAVDHVQPLTDRAGGSDVLRVAVAGRPVPEPARAPDGSGAPVMGPNARRRALRPPRRAADEFDL